MARVKRSVNAKKKRREVLDQASGYRGQRSRLYRKAKEQTLHSATYSFRDRRAKKGDFRSHRPARHRQRRASERSTRPKSEPSWGYVDQPIPASR